MEIERKTLLTALSDTRPALSSKDSMVQNLCYWFSGERCFAYNNIIGIDVPLETEFTGAVLGAPLYGVVSNSLAKKAKISVDKGSFNLKCGSSNPKLSAIPFDQAVWEFPKLPKKGIEISEDFCNALANVLLCADEQFGVSFICDGKTLCIAATDIKTIAFAKVDANGFPKKRVEVWPLFCEQLLALCSEGGTLYLEDDSIMAVSEDDRRVFGRILDIAEPLDYDQALGNNLAKGYEKRLAEIPPKFVPAIERALIMSGGEFIAVKHTIEEGKLHLFLKSRLGSLDEHMPFDVDYAVEASFDVQSLKKLLAKSERIIFEDDCAVMQWGENGIYIISAQV